jgi:hypothetical protein
MRAQLVDGAGGCWRSVRQRSPRFTEDELLAEATGLCGKGMRES